MQNGGKNSAKHAITNRDSTEILYIMQNFATRYATALNI